MYTMASIRWWWPCAAAPERVGGATLKRLRHGPGAGPRPGRSGREKPFRQYRLARTRAAVFSAAGDGPRRGTGHAQQRRCCFIEEVWRMEDWSDLEKLAEKLSTLAKNSKCKKHIFQNFFKKSFFRK